MEITAARNTFSVVKKHSAAVLTSADGETLNLLTATLDNIRD